MTIFFFSKISIYFGFIYIYIWMKGDSTTLDALIPLSEFLAGTGLPRDVVVLMHSTTSTCPKVGATCYPHFVDN
jgi:hypothetical protein